MLEDMTSELDLLHRAQRMEEKALIEIYDQFSPVLYRYAMRLLMDEDLAEDCVAETFSRFLHSLKCGKGSHQYLQAYLFRIAHNWITDCYRKNKMGSICLDEETLIDPGQDLQGNLAKKMENEKVRETLSRLTPDQRQVIALKFLEEWGNEEISTALAKPIGAVKALQHRALITMRKLMSEV
jgi:RNA polymerase sigma-70 factor (ECF subfamily)